MKDALIEEMKHLASDVAAVVMGATPYAQGRVKLADKAINSVGRLLAGRGLSKARRSEAQNAFALAIGLCLVVEGSA